MVLCRLKSSDLSGDTKQRIMDAAVNLFALKGFDGASIREIAKLANVNVASLNYHFKSKENLRQEMMNHMMDDFKAKILSIPKLKSSAEHAVKIFETITEDSARCLNQFKLFLEAESHTCEQDPYPLGYEQFATYFEEEMDPKVPQAERLWAVNIIFCYIIHTAVMSSTAMGKEKIEKFLPKKRASLPLYIQQLVETLVRDLNNRYA